jgi:hypothetical protein
VSAALAAVAKQKLDTSNRMGCNAVTDLCVDPGYGIRNDARTLGSAATGTLVAGGILAAGGAGILVAGAVLGKGPAPAVSAAIGPAGPSLALRGSF